MSIEGGKSTAPSLLCVAASSIYALVVNGMSLAAWSCKEIGHGPNAGEVDEDPRRQALPR